MQKRWILAVVVLVGALPMPAQAFFSLEDYPYYSACENEVAMFCSHAGYDLSACMSEHTGQFGVPCYEAFTGGFNEEPGWRDDRHFDRDDDFHRREEMSRERFNDHFEGHSPEGGHFGGGHMGGGHMSGRR